MAGLVPAIHALPFDAPQRKA